MAAGLLHPVRAVGPAQSAVAEVFSAETFSAENISAEMNIVARYPLPGQPATRPIAATFTPCERAMQPFYVCGWRAGAEGTVMR